MNFFTIEQPKPGSPEDRNGRTDSLPEEGFNVGECSRCPVCNRPISMLKWLPPYRVELQSWGKHYGDIAEIGDNLVFSGRFLQAFTRSELKGLLCVEPVDVIKIVHRRGKPMEPLPHYFKAGVARSATTVDQQQSGYVWEDKTSVCPECLFGKLKRYKAIIVNEETWTGEDIFFPRGGHVPIVSERFKQVFAENGLFGAVFIPVEEAGYDSCPWEIRAATKY